jgi:hypothetical protein
MERQMRRGRKRKRKCGVVRDTTVVQEKRKFDGSPCCHDALSSFL